MPGSGLGSNCFPALGSDPGLLNRGTPVTVAAANLEKIKVYTSRSPWDRAKVKGTECHIKGTECQGRERATGPPRTAGVAGHVGCHSGAYQHTG